MSNRTEEEIDLHKFEGTRSLHSLIVEYMYQRGVSMMDALVFATADVLTDQRLQLKDLSERLAKFEGDGK